MSRFNMHAFSMLMDIAFSKPLNKTLRMCIGGNRSLDAASADFIDTLRIAGLTHTTDGIRWTKTGVRKHIMQVNRFINLPK